MKKETEEKILPILEQAGIRPSPVRIMVLRELLKSGRPLSAQEMESRLETVDRSSITRTLSTFSEEHIIHPISDGSNSMRYELCTDTDREMHGDLHAHFHCRLCGVTLCLHNIKAVVPQLPEDYHAENVTYVITGVCPSCLNSKQYSHHE